MNSSTGTSNQKAVYLPGLNGIRAIAALTVILAHLNDHLLSVKTYSLPVLECGRLAVSMFFALSGFLITYLLILEKEKTGTVSIPKFYFRRILRIWPLYFTYIGVALLVAWFTGMRVELFPLMLLLFFAGNVTNVMGLTTPYTGHYWSLGVEEQFYIFWPWLIRLGKNIGQSVLFFLIAFSVLKFALRFGLGGYSTPYVFVFSTRFDCMAIGGIAAWWAYNGIPLSVKPLLFHPASQLLNLLALIVVVANLIPIPMVLHHQIVAILTSVLILNLTQNQGSLISLEGGIWRFLGDISFGLYVWHPLMIALLGYLIFEANLPPVAQIVLFLILTPLACILVAYGSLRFLETPFLRLKDRFAIIATKRHA